MSSTVFPLSPELVNLPQLTEDVDKIDISEESQKLVEVVSSAVEDEIKEIQKVKLFTHTYYSLAYQDERGKELFELIYSSPEFYQNITLIFESLGISEPSAESTKEEVEVWDLLWESVFEDVCEQVFKNTENPAFVLAKTTALIKDKYSMDIHEDISISKPTPQNKLNINDIPEGIRRASNKWSFNRSKELFINSFIENGGDITKVVNPQSNETLINIDNFILKIDKYRDLKARIKASIKELHSSSLQIHELLDYEPNLGNEFTQELSLNSYLERLCSLYQEYINYKIAEMYKYAVIVAKKPVNERSEAEDLLLTRFSLESNYIRSLETIDKFLNGNPQLSDELVEYGVARKLEQDPRDESLSEQHQRYNAYKLTYEQQIELARLYVERIRAIYTDFPEITIELHKGKQQSFSVVGSSRLKIPKLTLGLAEFLSKLSSEIEGHLYRRYLNDKQGHGYKYIAPRDSVLSEGQAGYISCITKYAITGIKRTIQPYYLQALETKESGGSFVECYNSVFNLVIKRRYGKTKTSELTDSELKVSTGYAYTTTDRIFRRATPHNDMSKRITSTEDLDYLRGEMVYSKLQQLGIEDLASIDGVDLYSLLRLRELGLVDLNTKVKPLTLIADEFWPKIKGLVDNSVAVENIASELRKNLPEK